MRKPLVAEAVSAQRTATLDVVRRLTADQWDHPGSGGRTPRDVAAHLLAVDAALTRWRIAAITRVPPEPGPLIGVNPVASARWRDSEPADLVAALERRGARLRRLVRALPGPLAQWPVRGPYRRRPYVALVAWRVLDEWVRTSDVVVDTAAAGPRGADAVAAVASARRALATARVDAARGTVLADAVLSAFPARVLPRLVSAYGVVRLVVDLAEPVPAAPSAVGAGPRRTWGIDIPRRQYGPRVTGAPDAVVRLTAPALVLVAAGRVAWRDLPAEALSIDGDGGLGAAVLDAVAPVSTEHHR